MHLILKVHLNFLYLLSYDFFILFTIYHAIKTKYKKKIRDLY